MIMRYGIVSDMHSNLEALDSCLDALSKERIDKYICIGDIVGYGADPSVCIKKVRELDALTVLGNHDAGCTGSLDLSYFNSYARDAIIWTKKVLSQSELDYLKGLELVKEMGDLTFTHGSLVNPGDFNYILNRHEALSSMEVMTKKILFIGHSHVPGVFERRDDDLRYFYREKIKVSENAVYIVNAGSVGQPRDGDNRASYVIYDDRKSEIFIKRIGYDISGAREKILKAGLPKILAYRLDEGK